MEGSAEFQTLEVGLMGSKRLFTRRNSSDTTFLDRYSITTRKLDEWKSRTHHTTSGPAEQDVWDRRQQRRAGLGQVGRPGRVEEVVCLTKGGGRCLWEGAGA